MMNIRQAQPNRLHLHRLTWVFAAWFGLGFTAASAQEPIAWKTGLALRKQLDASVSVSWAERPLRDALANLSRTTGVCIFLDRRIDPGQLVELTVRNEPLEGLLEKLAEKINAKVGEIGPVVVLGPPETAGKLRGLVARRHANLNALPAESKGRLLRQEAWQWDELAEPRALLNELTQQGNLTVENSDLVPHDLWPAADLPALPWVDRLTLLLAGFGLTYEFAGDGTAIRLVPIPDEVLVEKSYTPRGEPGPVVAQLRRLVPSAKIRVEGRKLLVLADDDDHDQIQKLLSGQSVKTTVKKAGEKRYSLTVENQAAGAVVKTVANQLNKEMKYSPELAETLQTKVTLVFSDVTLDELLTKTLAPLKLTYRVDDTAVEIVPAE